MPTTLSSPTFEKVRLLRTETRTYDRRIELVRALRPQVTAAQILAAVSASLPEGVSLDEAVLDDEGAAPLRGVRVRLSGAAPSESVVSQALSALDASPVFDRPVLLESKIAQPGEASRLFVIEVRAGGSRPAKE